MKAYNFMAIMIQLMEFDYKVSTVRAVSDWENPRGIIVR